MKPYEALKLFLFKKGVKQGAVAKAIGLSNAQFSSIANGHTRLTVEVLLDICNFTNTSPADFFTMTFQDNWKKE